MGVKRGGTYLYCFNRTFMELKYAFPMNGSLTMSSFNRTFMELKCENALDNFALFLGVLIVPLWN